MLVPIRAEDGIVLDIRYATADNLTGKPIYRRPVALLLPQAAALLGAARRHAAALGLAIKVFDAYRPIEAQWALWRALPDARYVSNPRLGGVHPRGAAIDLTLLDAATGAELDMGTGFDAVTEASAHASLAVPPAALRNRAVLLGLMTAAGWACYAAEWWHYQLHDAAAHPPLSASAVPEGPM
jgi:D-alanyl-D-alanine dipeptidase